VTAAEQQARLTASRAALADYQRWARGEVMAGDWQSWARRLAVELESVCDALADAPLTKYRPFIQHAFGDAVSFQRQIIAEPLDARDRSAGGEVDVAWVGGCL
jgi:hypothetical protein